MANITNRSPWVAKLVGSEPKKFRLKSQALAYLDSQGYPDPENLPKGALKQLATAFEVQIKRKDRAGKTVSRNSTFNSLVEAERWAKANEQELDDILQKNGGFVVEYETLTIQQALDRLLKEHYSSKASSTEIAHRTRLLAEWLGPDRLFKDITRPDLNRLLNMLQIEKGYSASSVRNFMTVLTTLYKHAAKRWDLPLENRASGLDLPKVQNAIQRYWTSNEKERLFASIDKTSPWLRPIVELSLAMAFRRGELVQSAQRKRGKDGQLVDTDKQSGGLRWEYIDWDNKTIQLPNEKNDHTKKNTEYRGRTVPLTTEVSKILLPLYKASETKRGLVFSATTNSVTQAFANCCKKAEPPIEGLTFHSLRKIATKDLSRLVKTPMELSRITGHKNIEVMNQRYFSVSPQDLLAQLDGSSGSLRHRAMTSLIAQFGQEQTRRFLVEVREAKSVQAFIDGATAEQADSDD